MCLVVRPCGASPLLARETVSVSKETFGAICSLGRASPLTMPLFHKVGWTLLLAPPIVYFKRKGQHDPDWSWTRWFLQRDEYPSMIDPPEGDR